MRLPLRSTALAGFLAIGGLMGLGTSTAQAQGHGGHHDGGHGGHHDGGAGGQYGGGYGGGYGVPSYSYYGNGGHDAQPHWHTRQTPYGSYSYYGLGRHDFRPHGHTVTPYGIESYNGRRTRSYSPPTPYTYRPW